MTRSEASSQLGTDHHGFTLVEVMIAMVILSIGLLGGVGTLHLTEQSLGQAQLSSSALALAEARLEAKRAARWEDLLHDDLDGDGIPEIVMQDSGGHGDRTGARIYTAGADRNGIRLTWTVEVATPLLSSSTAWIEVRARYASPTGQWKEVQLRTLRANPRYIGGR